MAEFTPNVLTNIGLDSHLNLSQTYMGRAAKLKRQRKQDRLSSPPLPTTPTQVVSPSERDIEREVSDFSDWLGDFRLVRTNFLIVCNYESQTINPIMVYPEILGRYHFSGS